jgi:hypothetical protein
MDMYTDMEVISQKPREAQNHTPRTAKGLELQGDMEKTSTDGGKVGEDIDRLDLIEFVLRWKPWIWTPTWKLCQKNPGKETKEAQTHTPKRVGAPKRYGKDRQGKGRIHKKKFRKHALTQQMTASTQQMTANICTPMLLEVLMSLS